MSKFYKVCGMFAIVAVLVAVFIEVSNIKYVEQPVEAVVINKEYVPSRMYTTIISTGKSCMPVIHHTSPEHKLIVDYQGLHDTINSEELYNALKVGDSIKMILVKKYTKDKNEYLGEYIKQP